MRLSKMFIKFNYFKLSTWYKKNKFGTSEVIQLIQNNLTIIGI